MFTYKFIDTNKKFSFGSLAHILIYNTDKTLINEFQYYYYFSEFSKIKPKRCSDEIIYMIILTDQTTNIALFTDIYKTNFNLCASIGLYYNFSFISKYTFIYQYFNDYIANMTFEDNFDKVIILFNVPTVCEASFIDDDVSIIASISYVISRKP